MKVQKHIAPGSPPPPREPFTTTALHKAVRAPLTCWSNYNIYFMEALLSPIGPGERHSHALEFTQGACPGPIVTSGH